MRFISCFSGVDAASVASKHLGWEALAFSEIAPFPSAVLAHHYPLVPNLGDITKIDWSEYHGKTDLMCGGSPCQAFSTAGLHKSLDDPRGNLTLEYMRAVHQVKPRWVLWENVPGVFSAKGNPFGCFLAGLAGYDAPIEPAGGKWASSGWLMSASEEGYSIAWRVLDAQHFGVPQRRKRIFLVGHRGTSWKPCTALLERSCLQGISSTCSEARNPTPRNARECITICDRTAGNLAVGVDFCPTLTLSCPPAIAITTANTSANGSNVSVGLSPTLTLSSPPAVTVSPTEIRRITPIEAERLQGFPDNYTRIPYKRKPAECCPTGARYKAMGNSWAVPVVRWIFERIDSVDAGGIC